MLQLTVIPLNSSSKIDCTLSSESTGQECLENVCQRISISQPEFFGLRYEVKGSTAGDMRWVDLDRPISRQLEKFSANMKVLYLRVMYYVLSGVSLINDEGTRNYYFLQLKHDVVEGRINCDPKQAVILANYSRQAEYGNHQDRHTVDYLKTLLSFPLEMIRADLLETLTEEVIHQAYELHNVTQGAAESLYISACQQLDGYGQETFAAKDENGADVTLGISVSGIIVASDANKFYPWRDIKNVLNHKKYFNIECSDPNENVRFTVSDSTTGSYIWRLCAMQHRFFARYEKNQTQASQLNLNLFQNENLNDSRDDLLNETQYQMSPLAMGQIMGSANWQSSNELANHTSVWNNAGSRSKLIVESQHSPHMASSTNIGSVGNLNNNSLMNANANVMQSRSSLQASTLDINLNSSTSVPLEYSNHGSNWAINPAGSNASLINRAQSSSCLDLSNNNVSQDRERLKALLPTYRPAPDYETAIQQKYRNSTNDVRLSNGNLLHLSASQMLAQDQGHLDYNITGSQPDVSYFNQSIQHQPTIHQQLYPDVTHHTTTHHLIGPHCSDASDYGLTHRFKMMRLVKPPPSYPANRLSSTSTPDLASHRALLGYRGFHVSGSSPDLVSTRPMVNPHHAQLMQMSQNNQILYAGTHQLRHSQNIVPHGTYENLNFVEPTKPGMLPPTQGGNLIYYMPREVEHLLITDGTQFHNGAIGINQKSHLNRSSQHINGSIEPIYENVPLPWKNENELSGEIRNRTASVQSAPGITRNGQEHQMAVAQPSPRFTSPESNVRSVPQPQPRAEATNHTITTKETFTIPSNQPPPLPNPPTPVPSAPEAMNRSHSTNILDSSAYSNYTMDTTHSVAHLSSSTGTSNMNHKNAHGSGHNDSGISSVTALSSHAGSQNVSVSTSSTSSTSVKETKRRKIWDILGGRSKNSADKQKSATLGREKDRKNKATTVVGGSGSKPSSGGSANSSINEGVKHRWSTGMPRQQPLPANISKEKLSSLLETKLADPQLYCEFERIPKRNDNAKYDCALADENKNKNFDPNFLPYDNNRVRLTPMRDNRMGYVNASHITSTVGNKQRFYIVAESPNDAVTTNTFWQCVWEADVYLLVQLSTELSYIPQTSERCLEYGQYQVWREFSQETDRCTTSKLRVYHTQSRRYRSVWHISYREWGDQNCPRDVGHFLGFLEELNSVRLASVAEVPPSHNTNPPVLIHCNEGGGRTGVTLIADLLMYTLDHNQDLDIPRLIGQIRMQRDNIIPSLAQYRFIHTLLIHYLKQTRLI
ncbi:tyrosine-protein phosphatase non-receptor type 14 isoform X2 [Toxorhynchites rutilus septentrionalis]|uniref:tyrosine-protein phosphatase non-receptor type 14 isoform X2 n=1 Tax=Toxorhynchites rutilus septentrionalis TaxID=329112 RepID=UPI002479B4BA|nr:tyrosine-protein phosphatase non-receptor type 14 isoform X2 [Toxorhynchites rutilus septentrionalis]